ncbi:MAG: AraC family transcriptional regulator [Corynebacterium sp.]|nr:AraC family transcriptional regulator [Corynebacterium sp.]MDN6283268.1 AraC family transcriptional regulator [Corynebacterium sp.]
MRGRPLRVRRVLHDREVDPVAYPEANIVVATAGWTNLHHHDRVVSLGEGDVAVLPARARVGGRPLSAVETVTLYLDPEFLTQQLSWASMSMPIATTLYAAAQGYGQILTLRPSAGERTTFVQRARRLAECDVPTEPVSFGLLGASLRFLATLDQPVDPYPVTIPRQEVRAIITAFRRDLARRWTATDLARQVNLSTSQLTRLFNSAFAVSPMRVLARLRAERFAELLQMTDWSVQRCAEAVGWPDPSYATRMSITLDINFLPRDLSGWPYAAMTSW